MYNLLNIAVISLLFQASSVETRIVEYLKANVRPEEAEAPAAAPKSPSHITTLETNLAEARQEIAALRTEVSGLRDTTQTLQEQITRLKEALGA